MDKKLAKRVFATPLGVPDHCGWMQLRTKRFGLWSKRWFQINSAQLHYFSPKKPEESLGHIIMHSKMSIESIPKKRIIILTGGTLGKKKYQMKSKTHEDFTEWMDVLKKSCQTGRRRRRAFVGKKMFSKNIEGSALPTFLEKMYSFLLKNGTHEHGVFRRPGHKTDIQNLMHIIEQGRFQQGLEKYSTYVVADCLKSYFGKLPSPLFPTEYYQMAVDISKKHFPPQLPSADDTESDEDDEEVLSDEIKKIVGQMLTQCFKEHDTNYKILKSLTRFLHLFSKHEDETGMGYKNLAIVFTPSLIRPKKIDVTYSRNLLSIVRLYEVMIVGYPTFFGEEEKVAEVPVVAVVEIAEKVEEKPEKAAKMEESKEVEGENKIIEKKVKKKKPKKKGRKKKKKSKKKKIAQREVKNEGEEIVIEESAKGDVATPKTEATPIENTTKTNEPKSPVNNIKRRNIQRKRIWSFKKKRGEKVLNMIQTAIQDVDSTPENENGNNTEVETPKKKVSDAVAPPTSESPLTPRRKKRNDIQTRLKMIEERLREIEELEHRLKNPEPEENPIVDISNEGVASDFVSSTPFKFENMSPQQKRKSITFRSLRIANIRKEGGDRKKTGSFLMRKRRQEKLYISSKVFKIWKEITNPSKETSSWMCCLYLDSNSLYLSRRGVEFEDFIDYMELLRDVCYSCVKIVGVSNDNPEVLSMQHFLLVFIPDRVPSSKLDNIWSHKQNLLNNLGNFDFVLEVSRSEIGSKLDVVGELMEKKIRSVTQFETYTWGFLPKKK